MFLIEIHFYLFNETEYRFLVAYNIEFNETLLITLEAINFIGPTEQLVGKQCAFCFSTEPINRSATN